MDYIATVLNNGDTLDGVPLATGDLVLVKNQTDMHGLNVDATTTDEAQDVDTYTDRELLQQALDLLHDRIGNGTDTDQESDLYLLLCLVHGMTPTVEQ